ncbi:LacI family DNA-binding transcriptional regulator [Buttiauxella selenatireducens]|uniref:LacI family DNA-binding transcriptional regulator n=1 Tax=Buttiauxella selenatireducens TaxID=3073902 RepID=A0ABY9S5Z7_9ENTR|nr:LacI family DNA-binding transcriptional regulator [Buttiauxella sp. R73]WMY72390.1 LacI family DNA-binding transcriptional regulator [Buttiauxella sp. R73]
MSAIRKPAVKTKSMTLYDVAKHAQVSYQTVSRVINQAEHVSDKTRRKVEASMRALNYVPNRVAQQLAGKLSQNIGLVTSNLSLHAPSQIASAIKTQASKLHFNVMMSMIEQPDIEACKNAVNSLLSQRVDGLIINIPLEDEQAQTLTEMCGHVPVLFLDVSPALNSDSITFDATAGTHLAIEHLVAQGHQRIALLNGPLTSVSARLRLEGWQQALAQHQLHAAAQLQGDWSSQSGYLQTLALLGQGGKFTALLVANDQMALGALRALNESGLSVPGHVSVIGYDDTEDSACFIPPLTTIKQDFKALGSASVDRLLEQIHSPNQPVQASVLPVTLIERKTTAAPNAFTTSPQALAEALTVLARQVAQLK